MEQLINKSKLSQLAKVARSTATRQLEGKLKPALVGENVNVNHPLVIAWLDKKNPTWAEDEIKPRPKPKRKNKQQATSRVTEKGEKVEIVSVDKRHIPLEIMDYIDWTLGELFVHKGSQHQFLDYVKSIKVMQEVETKDIANKQKINLLVTQEIIIRHFVEPLNLALTRILTDGKRTITQKMFSAIKAKKDVHAVEKIFAKEIKNHVEDMQEKMIQKLEELKELKNIA